MKEPLVSIITPCYNGGHVMHRLLDSILAQTYRPIEFILVNDGSTDSSAEVWNAYEPRFDAAGIKHQYIYQENQGLGAAINAGLQAFTGAYFCWPDIDDYLEGTSIKKRVAFLEENPEYGSVSSDAYEFLEEDLEHPIGTVAGWMKHIREPWQFRYMLQGQSVYCSGCHMLRTSCFLKVNPSRRIYPARRGQNNQLLLPIYYKYQHGFIDEPLYYYIIYKKSMSSPDPSEEQALDREREYIALLQATLSGIDMDKETRLFCSKQMRQIEWDALSKIYVRFGRPLKLIWCYLKLRMYQTEQKREIGSIVFALKTKLK